MLLKCRHSYPVTSMTPRVVLADDSSASLKSTATAVGVRTLFVVTSTGGFRIGAIHADDIAHCPLTLAQNTT